MLAPQDTIPSTPVSDRLGAERVPSTEAPLVTVWGSAGTRALRAAMLATAAAAATEAVMSECGLDLTRGCSPPGSILCWVVRSVVAFYVIEASGVPYVLGMYDLRNYDL